MTGETDLNKLIASMSPELTDGEYVFCSFAEAGFAAHARLEPIAAIAEAEGLTLVIPRSKADENRLGYESVFRRITLRVHSSLDAVGLTAAFSNQLAEHGISANVVAGFYHDHIFVPRESADAAMRALGQLACQ